MKMAVESMEMALGAIPHTGRVPEQRFLSPELGLTTTAATELFVDGGFFRLRVFASGEYIGERAMSVGGQGPHTLPRCGQVGTRA